MRKHTKYSSADKYKVDSLFVRIFLASIYAVHFGMNSPSRQGEPNGSGCRQSAWKMCLSQFIPGKEILLPKRMPHAFSQPSPNQIHAINKTYKIQNLGTT
jgi:hypothetical protein